MARGPTDPRKPTRQIGDIVSPKNKTSTKVNDQVHGHPLTDKHVAAAIGTRRGPVTFGPRLEFWTLFGFEFRTDWLVGRLGGGYC